MPTNEEIKAAAERIRRHHSGEEPADKAELFDDYQALYLAEHPADGDEPVTAEWLESQGWQYRKVVGEWSYTLPTGADLRWQPDTGSLLVVPATRNQSVLLAKNVSKRSVFSGQVAAFSPSNETA